MSQNNNLYQNKFINTRDQQFSSNEERFKKYMQDQNQNVLNQNRLPNPNLKTELVKNRNVVNPVKKEQKIRSSVISVNSKNRRTSNVNVTTDNKTLEANPIQISNGSKELIISCPFHNFKEGDEVELTNITNNYTSSNIFSLSGGTISSCTTGFNGIITTSSSHGLSVNSNVLIGKTNTVPSINKEVTVLSVPSSTQFTINSPINKINTGTGIWGSNEATVTLSNHGLNANSNVTISGVEDDVTLSSNPLSLSLSGGQASLTISYTNHPFNVDDQITITNAVKEISLNSGPILVKAPIGLETISDIEITMPDTNHAIENQDQITLSGVVVNHLLSDNKLRTLGGRIISISGTAGTVTFTTEEASHNLQTGNTVYFFNTKTVPDINNTAYTITNITGANTFEINTIDLKNIIRTDGEYGSKVINVQASTAIMNTNSFSTGKKIYLAGIENNLISNGLNNSYTVLNSTMSAHTSDHFQIDASNAFPSITPKVSELFGSNINIGSNFVDSTSISLNNLNKNFNIISGEGSTTLTVSDENFLNLAEAYTIGGTGVKVISDSVLKTFRISDINTTHTITSKTANDFVVNLGTTSDTATYSSFGGSNVVINKFNGVSNRYFNKTHLVKSITDSNNFTIELEKLPNTSISSIGGSDLSLTLDTINNIPLNQINAKEPRDSSHIYGNQVINVIDENNLKIFLPQKATIDKTFGGTNVNISKIVNFLPGYTNQNNYVIELDRKYENIYQISLISTEFVNSELIIKDSSFDNLQNNLVKIQIEGDSTIYTQELIEGNYDALTFSTMVADQLSLITTTDNLNLVFECDVSIDTGKLTLKNFIKTNLSKAFSVTQGSNIITVTHTSHGFSTGQVIKILNSSNVDSIVSTDINKKEHTITVVNANKYTFVVASTAQNTASNKGGKTIQILQPKNYKLLFSNDNTANNLFGFSKSDTSFLTSHTGSLQVDLSGDDYFYMCSPELGDTVKDDGDVESIFAKILLNQAPGNILYDTYVSNPKIYFDTPLKFLEKIEFTFKEPSNNLFFMNNLEHSFSLKIDEVIEIIENTNFSSRTGNFN